MKTNPIFAILGLGLTLLLTACPLTPAPEDSASTPSFTISIEPTSFTVEQLSNAKVRLTITPLNGFAGTVYLDLVQSGSGKPASGFGFSPISVDVPGPDPVTVPFTILVGSSAGLGTHSLEVRGTSGRITKGADFTITVNPPSDEGEESGGGGTTVRIVRLDDMPLMGAYYRTGNGPWKPLNSILTFWSATFTASGDYEVAVRCDLSDLHLFKANSARTPNIIFSCSEPDRSATFHVYLPREIGGTRVFLSDLVGVSDSLVSYPGFNPVVVSGAVFGGRWDLLFTVFSSPDNPFSPSGSFTPIGYKLANVLIGGGSGGVVDDTDWHPFSGVRTFTLNPPPGFRGGGRVSFFKNSVAVPTVTGIEGSYGTLPIPGKYIGFACAYSPNFDEFLFAMKDTGGLDWDARFPNPWASGQFAVNGNTLVFNYPQAQAYLFSATGIVENTATEEPYMRVIVHLFEGGNASYTLPEIPELSYRLADFHTRSVQFTLKAFQGHAFPLQGLTKDLFGCSTTRALYSLARRADLSEEALTGLDFSWAERWGTFSGNSYTLP